MALPLVQDAAWIDLAVTAFWAWRSRGTWQAYRRGQATRARLVNQLFLTGVLGAGDLLLFLVGAFVGG